jgi:DNA primase
VPTQIDTDRVRRDHPIERVAAGYGIELRRIGRALVGRCPLHADGGRPNLHVYPESRSWYCYRCAVGGDVISLVRRVERLDFHAAVTRLEGAPGPGRAVPVRTDRSPRSVRSRPRIGGPDERACLAAAVELYHNRLLGQPMALAYVEGRGLGRAAIERCRLGYASGEELAAYLRWRGLPAQAAMRVGLLGRDGRELLAGRVVVPEIRAGQPIWLVGRSPDDDPERLKYLGLPGPKPLLGWETAAKSPTAILVEGVFDGLALRQWGYPALALVGTHVRPAVVRALGVRFRRLYLALDADDAGRAASEALRRALGPRAVALQLPTGVKDVADLALRPDGRAAFARALSRA